MGLADLKEKYNKTISREQKAREWLDKATEKQLEKWLPEYHKIVNELSLMMQEYKALTNKEMTDKQVFEGFKEG